MRMCVARAWHAHGTSPGGARAGARRGRRGRQRAATRLARSAVDRRAASAVVPARRGRGRARAAAGPACRAGEARLRVDWGGGRSWSRGSGAGGPTRRERVDMF
eukprot:scaffold5275_cov60-Phaeocystis_antarctica.AAC.2